MFLYSRHHSSLYLGQIWFYIVGFIPHCISVKYGSIKLASFLIASKFSSLESIVFAEIDLKDFHGLHNKCHVWNYKCANTAQIKNGRASFNWKQALSNSSIDKKISILNETIINAISNYIPN